MRNEDIAETFNASGADYEASAQDLINLAASELVARLNLQPGQDFIDLGSGPGAVVAFAEPHVSGGSAIGIDLSRVQLALARERFRLSPLQPRFMQRDAEATGLRSRSADAVGLGLVLHYSYDPKKLLTEAVRLTKLGGRVAATILGPPFFGSPGARLLVQMERRGVLWPEVELQIDSRQAVQMALLCEVEEQRLDDVTIEEIEREFWWDDFESWWRMLGLWGFLPQGRDRMMSFIARDLREDERVVSPDGKVRCAMRIWVLSGTVSEGDPLI